MAKSLSERANKYLASLQRLPALPARVVEMSLRAQGVPCFAAWLAFHERYAGYVESLGNGESAVWGIAHESPRYLDPRFAHVDHEIDDTTWYVTCADVHQSYVYNLDNAGRFFTPDAETFEVRVEQSALYWTFLAGRTTSRSFGKDLVGEAAQAQLRHALVSAGAVVISEASDHNYRYSAGEALMVRENVEHALIDLVWRIA